MPDDEMMDWPVVAFADHEYPVHPAVHRVVGRARDAGLKSGCRRLLDFDMKTPCGPVTGAVFLPDGSGERELRVDQDNAEAWANAEFEHWHLIDGYDAVWDSHQGTITATVTMDVRGAIGMKNVPGVELVEPGRSHKGFSLRVATADDRLSMTLVRPRPSELEVISGSHRDTGLVIRGVRAASHEEAARMLVDLALPFFVDLSVSFDIRCRLSRPFVPERGDRDAQPGVTNQPRFPVTQYNHDAASLYLYAISLTSLAPVMFRYLAFFQVIEFFAPMHARGALITRLRNAIKDPSFNPSDDATLGRVVTMLSGGGRNTMSDREQLTTTVRACVEEDEFVEWLNARPVASKALADKHRMAGVRLVQPKDRNNSLVAQAAERIYDLRCRIVHAKEDGSYVEPLRLFESNSEVLVHDLDLVRFVAERVLVASSSPATWR